MKSITAFLYLLFLVLLQTMGVAALQAQTFNRLYPDAGGRPGISSAAVAGGHRLTATADPSATTVEYIDLTTDEFGVLVAQEYLSVYNPLLGRCTRLSDGNIAIAVETDLNDMRLTKKTPNGTVLWTREYNLPLSLWAVPGMVVENAAGELFLFGVEKHNVNATGRLYLVKAHADGTEIWVKEVEALGAAAQNVSVSSGLATADGGFVLAASASGPNGDYLLRFDADGNLSYLQDFQCCYFHSPVIAEGSTGKLAFASSHTDPFGSPATTAWVRQYGPTGGTPEWETPIVPFDAPVPSDATAHITALSATSDGGFLAAGFASAAGLPDRFFLAKLDAAGNLVWNHFNGGFTADPAFVGQGNDGRISVCGTKDGHTWLLVADSLGNVACSPVVTALAFDICEGTTLVYGNDTLSSAGHHVYVYPGQTYCDSIVHLDLEVRPNYTATAYHHQCVGEPSPFTGNVYDTEGIYDELWQAQTQWGCDSTVQISLEVSAHLYYEGWGEVPYGEIINGVPITEVTFMTTYDTTEYGCIIVWGMVFYPFPNAVNDAFEESIGLKVFPSPFCEELHLQLDLPETARLRVSLIDSQGRRTAILLDENRKAGPLLQTFPTNALPQGLYFLQVEVNGQTGTRKLVKTCD